MDSPFLPQFVLFYWNFRHFYIKLLLSKKRQTKPGNQECLAKLAKLTLSITHDMLNRAGSQLKSLLACLQLGVEGFSFWLNLILLPITGPNLPEISYSAPYRDEHNAHCALFGRFNFAQRASGSLLLTNGPSYI